MSTEKLSSANSPTPTGGNRGSSIAAWMALAMISSAIFPLVLSMVPMQPRRWLPLVMVKGPCPPLHEGWSTLASITRPRVKYLPPPSASIPGSPRRRPSLGQGQSEHDGHAIADAKRSFIRDHLRDDIEAVHGPQSMPAAGRTPALHQLPSIAKMPSIPSAIRSRSS